VTGAYPRVWIVALAVAVEGGLVVLALGLGWLLSEPPFATWSWHASDVAAGCVLTAPPLLAAWLMVRTSACPLPGVRRFTLEVVCPALSSCATVDLILIALLAGLGEEALFRGVVQAALTRSLGLWAGLGLASLLFGVIHAATPGYAILAAILGVYLGTVWALTGDLVVPVIVHGLYDLGILLYLMRGPGRRLWQPRTAVLPEVNAAS
jgi:membrane protease YdiL (CAAX protease family)